MPLIVDKEKECKRFNLDSVVSHNWQTHFKHKMESVCFFLSHLSIEKVAFSILNLLIFIAENFVKVLQKTSKYAIIKITSLNEY